MKILYTLLFLLCGFIVSAQSNSAGKYFEGIIEYDIKAESFMQGVSANEIRERTGSTLKLYFKNGDYLREYIDGAGFTLRKFMYRKDKNMVYLYYPISSPDTIYFTPAGDTSYVSYEIHAGGKEKILDYDCPSSVITAKYTASYLPDTATLALTYFFCNQLPVNPEWHKDVYIWNEVIKIHQSIAIKFIEDDPGFLKQTFTATKIVWQPVDDSVFMIDPILVLKALPKE
jgi:hypothetical protein